MTSAPDSIDWAGIRRRMAEVSAVLDSGTVRSPEKERELLKARAHALALPPAAAGDEGEEVLQVIEFVLANEHYALPLAQVQAVSELKNVTPVPCTPSFIVGLINLRGEIHTVIDLKKFFDLPSKGITEQNKVILIQHGDLWLGLLADTIRGVARIPLASLDPAPPTLTGIRADYLRGVTGDRLVVLDAEKILSDQRLLVHEEVVL